MKDKTKYSKDYTFYTLFWKKNLAIIERIAHILQEFLNELENESLSLEEADNAIENKISILSSRYSSYTTLAGKEYLLRIRTVLREYLSHTPEGDTSLHRIHFLRNSINKLKEQSLQHFSRHHENIRQQSIQRPVFQYTLSLPYKKNRYTWLTFFRNNSWFLVPYTIAYIIPRHKVEFVFDANQDARRPAILFNSSRFIINDLFGHFFYSETVNPSYYVIVKHRKTRCFAAEKIGKHFIAQKNIMIERLKPFKGSRYITKGYLSFAGVTYIYLNLEKIHD
jgi:hypothetical protein